MKCLIALIERCDNVRDILVDRVDACRKVFVDRFDDLILRLIRTDTGGRFSRESLIDLFHVNRRRTRSLYDRAILYCSICFLEIYCFCINLLEERYEIEIRVIIRDCLDDLVIDLILRIIESLKLIIRPYRTSTFFEANVKYAFLTFGDRSKRIDNNDIGDLFRRTGYTSTRIELLRLFVIDDHVCLDRARDTVLRDTKKAFYERFLRDIIGDDRALICLLIIAEAKNSLHMFLVSFLLLFLFCCFMDLVFLVCQRLVI